MSTFTELGLNKNIIKALTDLGYENPTEIQLKAIPQVLTSRNDLKAFAQTGTGKTAAFSLPILEQIDIESNDTQAIILSPTRELAIQIAKNVKNFPNILKVLKLSQFMVVQILKTKLESLKKEFKLLLVHQEEL